MQRVGSINTYLGLTKDELEGETQASPQQPSMQNPQQRILLLGVLNGNPNGLDLRTLQSLVGASMPSDVLRGSVSELLKRGLVEVAAVNDPLNPSVKITDLGKEQLSLWA